jgi:serine/threonine-protein kinase
MIEFRALGAAQLVGPEGTDTQAVLARPKLLGLLAFLSAGATRGFHRRDSLIGCFWPEMSQDRARSAVRQSLYRLRQFLGDSVVVTRGDDEVSLSDEGFWSDVAAFEDALARGDRAAALELYRGDLLEGLYVPDAPEFERWIDERRKHLREQASTAAWELADQEAELRHTAEAGRWSRRARHLAPLDERLLRRVIKLLDGLGDRAGAVREYETFARRVAIDLELEPAPETRVLIEGVRERSEPVASQAPSPIHEPSADSGAAPHLQHFTDALADRYRLGPQIGAGGMATVYRARDLRHERDVAVKVMHPDLSAHTAAERFLREIRIAANLTHPHIVPVYDSGSAEGQLYFVMPLIHGESLRGRLERDGQLPLDDALTYARDVAEALAYAHAQGVVHRDVKPENILLAGSNALVADFGIARAVSAAGDARLTRRGMVVGTPGYISPEQASGGGAVDHRNDLYSFGCVLYEMLAGQPPFTGDNTQAVLAAHVLEQPRPLAELRPDVPARLSQAVMRCLEKEAAERWQTVDELLAQLQAVATPSGGVTPTGATPAVSRRSIAVAAASAVVIAAVLALLVMRGGPSIAPAARHTQLTFSGNVTHAEISPDGELLAYVEQGDPSRLFVKDLTGGTVIDVAAIRSSIGALGSLRWSPDGASLLYAGFDSTGRNVTVTYPRLGGPPRQLSGVVAYVVWSPDGSQVAHWLQGGPDGRNPIRLTTLATHDTGSVETPDSIGAFLYSGDWSPRGGFIALASSEQSPPSYQLWTVALEGTGSHRLVQDTVLLAGPRWSPTGDAVYYLRGDELRKLRVAPDGRARGTHEVLQAGLDAAHGIYNPGLSLTADGRTLVFTKAQSHSNIWLLTADATAVQLTQGTAAKSAPRLSPDGTRIAYVRFEGAGGDVYVVPTDGGTPRRLSAHGQAVTNPVWSPDGTALAFGARIEGKIRMQTVLLDVGQVRTYQSTEMGENGLAWAPGRRIVYARPNDRDFHLLDPETEAEEPLVANDTVGWVGFPHVSPDGERVAFLWNRRTQRGTWVASLRDASQALMYPGRFDPVGWAANGQAVYVREHGADDILLVPLSGGDATVVATVPYANAQDCLPIERATGLALLCNVVESVSDAWMIEGFDPEVR